MEEMCSGYEQCLAKAAGDYFTMEWKLGSLQQLCSMYRKIRASKLHESTLKDKQKHILGLKKPHRLKTQDIGSIALQPKER